MWVGIFQKDKAEALDWTICWLKELLAELASEGASMVTPFVPIEEYRSHDVWF